jgi:hypothetical protein
MINNNKIYYVVAVVQFGSGRCLDIFVLDSGRSSEGLLGISKKHRLYWKLKFDVKILKVLLHLEQQPSSMHQIDCWCL